MKKFAVYIPFLMIIGLLFTTLWVITDPVPEITHAPGILAPQAPVQERARKPSWDHKGYKIASLASIKLKARVLSKKRYRFDREADLVPFDLALGWMDMSDQSILDQLAIGQGGRWYYWASKAPPMHHRMIERQSANMHIIPADNEILRTLKDIKIGDVIELEGYLVQAHGDDNWSWRSSTTRDDTGPKACELIWTEKLEIVTDRLSAGPNTPAPGQPDF